MLKLQRPAKTSRTSSKPPSTDRKERHEQSRPGGAKPGHDGQNRVVAEDPDTVVDRRPTACPDCGLALSPDLPVETISVHEHIELPEVKPVVEQHRRLAVVCPGCRVRVAAPRPASAASTPLRVSLSNHRPAPARHGGVPKDVPGPVLRAPSEGPVRPAHQPGKPDRDPLMLRRAKTRFEAGREAALSALRRATVVASDETGVRIEGTNSYHWDRPVCFLLTLRGWRPIDSDR